MRIRVRYSARSWVAQEAVKVNPKRQWRLQFIGNARNMAHPLKNAIHSKWSFCISSESILFYIGFIKCLVTMIRKAS